MKRIMNKINIVLNNWKTIEIERKKITVNDILEINELTEEYWITDIVKFWKVLLILKYWLKEEDFNNISIKELNKTLKKLYNINELDEIVLYSFIDIIRVMNVNLKYKKNFMELWIEEIKNMTIKQFKEIEKWIDKIERERTKEEQNKRNEKLKKIAKY